MSKHVNKCFVDFENLKEDLFEEHRQVNWASSGLETEKKVNELSNTIKPRNLEEEALGGKEGTSDLHNVLMHGGLNTATTGNQIMSNNQVDL